MEAKIRNNLKELNAKLGFWRHIDERGGVRCFEWKCGCAGMLMDDETVELAVCEDHEDFIDSSNNCGIPDWLFDKILDALNNKEKNE
jgi:hypothetical protein